MVEIKKFVSTHVGDGTELVNGKFQKVGNGILGSDDKGRLKFVAFLGTRTISFFLNRKLSPENRRKVLEFQRSLQE